MWTTLDDFRQVMGSRQFWSSTIRLAVLLAFGLALLLIAFTALIVLLPLAAAAGLALHLYLRRRLRRARTVAAHGVIEGEYSVLDGR
jgi:hypothetical protein